MHKHKNIEMKDKMELSTQFKRRVFQPNERFFVNYDQIDAVYLIIEGQVGIFYPDLKVINSFPDRQQRVVNLTAEEANRRLEKRRKTLVSSLTNLVQRT